MKLSEQSNIKEIYENEQGKALLEQYLPKLVRSPSFQMTYAMSFGAVCKFRRWKLKRAVYAEAAAALGEIEI
jgi:hypothetical protein